MRRAPPVTSAAWGIGATGKAPVTSSGADTAMLGAGAHLGAHHLARRHAGAAQGRAAAHPIAAGRLDQSELCLFEAADLVAQPRRLLEFEIGGGGPHAFFEVGDDRLQVLALVVRRVALAEPDRP